MFFDHRTQRWLDIRLHTYRNDEGQVVSSLVAVPEGSPPSDESANHSGLPPSPRR